MAKKKLNILGLMVVSSMLLASCGGTADNTPVPATAVPATAVVAEPTAMPATAMPATAMPATAMPATTPGGSTMDRSQVGAELVDAYAGKLKGTKVTMFGPFGAEDEVKFNNSIKDFETATGIDIVYEGSKEFETTINTRVKGGSAPDIADFPQPGLMATVAKTGKILDASKFINPAWLKKNYNQSFLDMGTVDNGSGTKELGGIFQRVNGKSLVWYPKKEFDAAGYTIPQTWDDMIKLMDKMVADGTTPWCIGIELGTATGWPATDWIEDIMLRTTSLENYDKWVLGTLPFTSPEVKAATQKMAEIWLNLSTYMAEPSRSSTPASANWSSLCLTAPRSATCTARATSSPVSLSRLRPASRAEWTTTSSICPQLIRSTASLSSSLATS